MQKKEKGLFSFFSKATLKGWNVMAITHALSFHAEFS